jgi:ABC-type transport system involved in multi-copper enzyme maturation permease subunit
MTAAAASEREAAIPRFGDLCRGEWTKIRSVRSTGWSLLVMAALSLGFSVFYAAKLVSSWPTLDAAGRNGFTSDPVAGLLQPGATFGQLAVGVLGVLLMASEYSTGMIRVSVLAVPRRTPILAAKAAVFGAVVFAAALAVAVPAFLVGSAITSKHASTSIGQADTVRAILGFGAFMVLTGLIELAIGAITGRPVAGLGAMIGLQYVAPLVLSFFSGSLAGHLLAALPATSASAIMSNGHNADNVYPPLASLGILAAWAVALLTAGFIAVMRRDVP